MMLRLFDCTSSRARERGVCFLWAESYKTPLHPSFSAYMANGKEIFGIWESLSMICRIPRSTSTCITLDDKGQCPCLARAILRRAHQHRIKHTKQASTLSIRQSLAARPSCQSLRSSPSTSGHVFTFSRVEFRVNLPRLSPPSHRSTHRGALGLRGAHQVPILPGLY